jgi:hypothetical protein
MLLSSTLERKYITDKKVNAFFAYFGRWLLIFQRTVRTVAAETKITMDIVRSAQQLANLYQTIKSYFRRYTLHNHNCKSIISSKIMV